MMKRLALSVARATPMFVAIIRWWPLNIMFMLLLVVATVYLLERGGTVNQWAAGLLFVFAGGYGEFWWLGVVTCLAPWAYRRKPSWRARSVRAGDTVAFRGQSEFVGSGGVTAVVGPTSHLRTTFRLSTSRRKCVRDHLSDGAAL